MPVLSFKAVTTDKEQSTAVEDTQQAIAYFAVASKPMKLRWRYRQYQQNGLNKRHGI